MSDIDDVELVTVTLTCHAEDCENSGVGIALAIPVDTTVFVCGACVQLIHDIHPPLHTSPAE